MHSEKCYEIHGSTTRMVIYIELRKQTVSAIENEAHGLTIDLQLQLQMAPLATLPSSEFIFFMKYSVLGKSQGEMRIDSYVFTCQPLSTTCRKCLCTAHLASEGLVLRYIRYGTLCSRSRLWSTETYHAPELLRVGSFFALVSSSVPPKILKKGLVSKLFMLSTRVSTHVTSTRGSST